MPAITVFRGFKISVSKIDAFLVAKVRDETFGHPPVPQQDAEISALLRSEMHENDGKSDTDDTCKADARLIIPQREAYSLSDTAYVAYTWLNIFVQRRLQLADELSEEVPPSFEQLRQRILSYGSGEESSGDDDSGDIGLFIVYTGNRSWTPEELHQRVQAPILCDECNQTFQSFADRQKHRQDVHGSEEGGNPLPQT